MNRDEKKGCEDILRKIDLADILSLKDTVTKRQIAAENRKEAIQAILTYSESSTELLRRKKIRREVIFQYLADNNVAVSVNAEKYQLITKTQQFWGVQVPTSAHALESSAGGDVNHNTSECQTETRGQATSGTQSSETVQTHAGTQAFVTPDNTQLVPHQRQNGRQNTQVQHHIQGFHPYTQVQIHTPGAQLQPVTPLQAPAVQTALATSVSPEQQKLGETFVSWFFRILNSHNPTLNQTPEDFGPHHFWNDVKLNLLTVTGEERSECFEGGVLVSQRFLALVREEQLLFNPNVSREGTTVKSDPHGLLIIMVCGTLHRGNDCLGIFQQMFGLIGDPRFDNNWKIKVTKLKIQSTQVTAIPRLEDSDNREMMSLVPI